MHLKAFALGLGKEPPSLKAMEEMGVKMLLRQVTSSSIKCRTWLVDIGNTDLTNMKGAAIVPEDSSWYTVQTTESIVVLSEDGTLRDNS